MEEDKESQLKLVSIPDSAGIDASPASSFKPSPINKIPRDFSAEALSFPHQKPAQDERPVLINTLNPFLNSPRHSMKKSVT